MWLKTKVPGIYVRHEKACAANERGRCRDCRRSWRVRYRDEHDRNDKGHAKTKWSRTFHSEGEARSWQVDRSNANEPEAKVFGTAGRTMNALADDWFALAESGAISQKGNGKRYGDGTLETYRRMYDNHVRGTDDTPAIGSRVADTLTAQDWQAWLDSLVRKGLKRNSISVTLNCVRSVYRWACSPNRGLLPANATVGLELPARDETPRDRVATPEEALQLIGALDMANGSSTLTIYPCDQVAYALSIYAGLRNVERGKLDWNWIDIPTFSKIRLMFTKGGEEGAGIRTLPVVAPLRAILMREWLRQGKPESGLVVQGPKGGAPEYDAQVTRAKKMWEVMKLDAIGFHECRHTFITTMIHSGLNAKAVQILAGHASIQITYDRYGHLFPGSEDEAAVKLDAYYAQAVAA